MLTALNEWTIMLEASKDIVNKSLQSDFTDFEDAIQYYSALTNQNIECIVTRNTKDYKKSVLPVMTPREVLKCL